MRGALAIAVLMTNGKPWWWRLLDWIGRQVGRDWDRK
jgi:hypothetical protein